ncbi:MAG TPA: sigma-70 family RNA polymerase sigma factor [Verrucomicrobiales bacterium]|jgi:RNA polymerase sigma-70 factor (ECF subfamily)|nr:sigma-70 family RNA polymerase sigma factor [Verrucomicrobiales bacterium]
MPSRKPKVEPSTAKPPEPSPEEAAKEEFLKVTYERTRKSLIERLGNWEDQKSWDDFHRTYWRLIYGVGLKSGLRHEEALDVVQETILAIAKQSRENRYDPKAGSFKVWLMNMTRWRIGDQFRRRAKDTAMNKFEDDDRKTATLDRFADPKAEKLEGIWDLEWKQNIADRAIATVKQRVSPRQFQIFDAYVVKGWSVKKVMTELGVSMAQVYLAKHRVGGLIKKEIAELAKQLI